METKEFITFLDIIFKSFGFRKRGNNWFTENNELIKLINLQRSNFGKFYYLNYGFILKSLDLGNLAMHIYNGLGSLDENENRRIKQLLNLKENIEDAQRKAE